MTDREVRILVETFSAAELNMCLIWKRGWSEWKKLKEIPELIAAEPQPTIIVPPLPRMQDEDEEEITQVRLLHTQPQKESEVRRHARYKVSVSVEIIKGEQSFQTKTADVSESGVRFVEDMPDWVAGYFTIIFKVKTDTFEVTGALVEDQKNVKNRAEVVDTNDEESGLPKYLAWVRSLESHGGDTLE